ncbi:hypothetical protein [Flavobacterium phragmitis]|uniref:Uncharacterized protein n=1 Tax=Flavobacterium phragmitis TaxID=739143 RepID=A0A1I1W1W3_9FLAO|nr:hypothetical protein [Flavobacterium phragmitis]SFD89276.1 hypothetical protein SAMN05216297_11438 [Flavobacterium phragmitis]
MNEIIEDSQDFYDDLSGDTILKELQKSEDDIRNGRTISFSEFKEKLQKKYNIKN